MPKKEAGFKDFEVSPTGEAVQTQASIKEQVAWEIEAIAEYHEQQNPLFERSLWKDTVPVLKCVKCGSFRNESEKDDFILHILTHYQNEEEKEAIFNRLLKELN